MSWVVDWIVSCVHELALEEHLFGFHGPCYEIFRTLLYRSYGIRLLSANIIIHLAIVKYQTDTTTFRPRSKKALLIHHHLLNQVSHMLRYNAVLDATRKQ